MESFFDNYVESHNRALFGTIVTTKGGHVLGQQEGVDMLCCWSGEIKNKNKKQHFIGNGASMAFANHMALDWTKNGGVKSFSYASAEILSAVVNDLGSERMFSSPLNWYGEKGDLLITTSSSGNSINILKAIDIAKINKMKIVTFSGLEEDNKCRKLGDLNFYVSAKTYGIVECCHQVLLHLWLDQYMNTREWARDECQNMSSETFRS